MEFRLTGEVGEKKAGKRENHPKMAQKKVRPFSPDFGPKTRKQSVAGQWDRKVSVLFSSRQSGLRNVNKLHLRLGIFLELFFGGIDLITLIIFGGN